MAVSKGLNPRAPEYTSIFSHETTSPTDAPPPSVLVSVLSTTLHCYYPQPAPHLYFHTLTPPSYSPHLYANPYFVHPQPVAVAQLPSPATENSAPPTVTEHATDYHCGQVVSEEVRHRAPRRGFRRGGKREEFGGRERAVFVLLLGVAREVSSFQAPTDRKLKKIIQ
ncbi:hypothetical protein F0562_021112 [Nyssa sinensis]|uniref:Uncharacterized protein n=1 Tax=Nyssa sinensis TaxID=561372 RepID=A0A5J5BK04_9ASTE|nr:hypothetical protein F0562_021112 [Nyssa sinensis]